MKTPLVSVIMPVYNAAPFLSQALRSILNQTYKNIELVVIDDNSTDDSWKIIQRFKKLHPKKIRVLRMKRNLNRGGDLCANEGIQIAKGQLIARMDADDISYHDRLEKQVAFLQKNKHIFMVGGSADVVNGDGEKVGEKNMPLTNSEILAQYPVFHPMIHPTVMFRKRMIKRKNFYSDKLSSNNDYLTFFSLICQNFQFANLPNKLIQYRIYGHNNSLQNIKRNFLNTLKARVSVISKYYYPFTINHFVKNIAQFLVVMLLPEKVTFYLYLITRGIVTKEDIIDKILPRPLPSFSRT